MSSKVDNADNKFSEPTLKKLWGQGGTMPLLNLRYLDWPTVHHHSTQSAVRKARSGNAPPVTARPRVARSFHRLSRRDKRKENGAAGAASTGHVGTKRAARIPQLLQTLSTQELGW